MKKTKPKPRWYENYLPFVARSPERQVEWLVAAFRKGALTREEVTPYIKLLLTSEEEEYLADLEVIINRLERRTIDQLLESSDIYDTPKLFRILKAPTVEQGVIVMRKTPPPYEKDRFLVLNKVFQSVYDCSQDLMEKAVAIIRAAKEEKPAYFEEACEKFQEVLKDQELLSALYPKARG